MNEGNGEIKPQDLVEALSKKVAEQKESEKKEQETPEAKPLPEKKKSFLQELEESLKEKKKKREEEKFKKAAQKAKKDDPNVKVLESKDATAEEKQKAYKQLDQKLKEELEAESLAERVGAKKGETDPKIIQQKAEVQFTAFLRAKKLIEGKIPEDANISIVEFRKRTPAQQAEILDALEVDLDEIKKDPNSFNKLQSEINERIKRPIAVAAGAEEINALRENQENLSITEARRNALYLKVLADISSKPEDQLTESEYILLTGMRRNSSGEVQAIDDVSLSLELLKYYREKSESNVENTVNKAESADRIYAQIENEFGENAAEIRDTIRETLLDYSKSTTERDFLARSMIKEKIALLTSENRYPTQNEITTIVNETYNDLFPVDIRTIIEAAGEVSKENTQFRSELRRFLDREVSSEMKAFSRLVRTEIVRDVNKRAITEALNQRYETTRNILGLEEDESFDIHNENLRNEAIGRITDSINNAEDSEQDEDKRNARAENLAEVEQLTQEEMQFVKLDLSINEGYPYLIIDNTEVFAKVTRMKTSESREAMVDKLKKRPNYGLTINTSNGPMVVIYSGKEIATEVLYAAPESDNQPDIEINAESFAVYEGIQSQVEHELNHVLYEQVTNSLLERASSKGELRQRNEEDEEFSDKATLAVKMSRAIASRESRDVGALLDQKDNEEAIEQYNLLREYEARNELASNIIAGNSDISLETLYITSPDNMDLSDEIREQIKKKDLEFAKITEIANRIIDQKNTDRIKKKIGEVHQITLKMIEDEGNIDQEKLEQLKESFGNIENVDNVDFNQQLRGIVSDLLMTESPSELKQKLYDLLGAEQEEIDEIESMTEDQINYAQENAMLKPLDKGSRPADMTDITDPFVEEKARNMPRGATPGNIASANLQVNIPLVSNINPLTIRLWSGRNYLIRKYLEKDLQYNTGKTDPVTGDPIKLPFQDVDNFNDYYDRIREISTRPDKGKRGTAQLVQDYLALAMAGNLGALDPNLKVGGVVGAVGRLAAHVPIVKDIKAYPHWGVTGEKYFGAGPFARVAERVAFGFGGKVVNLKYDEPPSFTFGEIESFTGETPDQQRFNTDPRIKDQYDEKGTYVGRMKGRRNVIKRSGNMYWGWNNTPTVDEMGRETKAREWIRKEYLPINAVYPNHAQFIKGLFYYNMLTIGDQSGENPELLKRLYQVRLPELMMDRSGAVNNINYDKFNNPISESDLDYTFSEDEDFVDTDHLGVATNITRNRLNYNINTVSNFLGSYNESVLGLGRLSVDKKYQIRRNGKKSTQTVNAEFSPGGFGEIGIDLDYRDIIRGHVSEEFKQEMIDFLLLEGNAEKLDNEKYKRKAKNDVATIERVFDAIQFENAKRTIRRHLLNNPNNNDLRTMLKDASDKDPATRDAFLRATIGAGFKVDHDKGDTLLNYDQIMELFSNKDIQGDVTKIIFDVNDPDCSPYGVGELLKEAESNENAGFSERSENPENLFNVGGYKINRMEARVFAQSFYHIQMRETLRQGLPPDTIQLFEGDVPAKVSNTDFFRNTPYGKSITEDNWALNITDNDPRSKGGLDASGKAPDENVAEWKTFSLKHLFLYELKRKLNDPDPIVQQEIVDILKETANPNLSEANIRGLDIKNLTENDFTFNQIIEASRKSRRFKELMFKKAGLLATYVDPESGQRQTLAPLDNLYNKTAIRDLFETNGIIVDGVETAVWNQQKQNEMYFLTYQWFIRNQEAADYSKARAEIFGNMARMIKYYRWFVTGVTIFSLLQGGGFLTALPMNPYRYIEAIALSYFEAYYLKKKEKYWGTREGKSINELAPEFERLVYQFKEKVEGLQVPSSRDVASVFPALKKKMEKGMYEQIPKIKEDIDAVPNVMTKFINGALGTMIKG